MPPDDRVATAAADLSVIVPAYQASDTIARALRSIGEQSVRPREIVVVDDGSTDGTAGAAELAAADLDQIAVQVIRQAHAGPGAARNRALAAASGRYVAFLDADDEWLRDKLARCLDALTDRGLTLVTHDLEIINPGGAQSRTECRRNMAKNEHPFVAQYLWGFVATSTVVGEKSAIEKAGGFDPSLPSGQDYDLWLAVLGLDTTRIDVLPEALARYHVRPGSISSRIDLRRQCATRIARARAHQLVGPTQSPAAVFRLRLLIIQFQALQGHMAQHRYISALSTALLAPFRAIFSRKMEPTAEADAAPSPFLRTRVSVEDESGQAQDRNRLWWENMPMSYADWSAEDRKVKNANQYEEIERYVFANSPYFREAYKFGSRAKMNVLDLGCGSGVFSCLFAKNGAQVTSVDLTETAVTMTAQNSRAQDLSVRVVRADAENLPLDENSFDYVFSWGVLHHTADMAAALREVQRVLRPGGEAMIMVYHRRSWVYVGHGLYWLLVKGMIFRGRTLRTVQDVYTDGYFHRYLTRRELTDMAARAGLKPQATFVTQYEKKIIPAIPAALDRWLKARIGMCVAIEVEKSAA